MTIKELMTTPVISLRQEETADTAAKLLSRHNIGAAPVVDRDNRVVGMLTDRDLVLRCMAAGLDPGALPVSRIMTPGPVTALGSEDARTLAQRMGREQIRRVPVVEDGALTGIVSLADLTRSNQHEASEALARISDNVSRR